jgi:hypothetical protein
MVPGSRQTNSAVVALIQCPLLSQLAGGSGRSALSKRPLRPTRRQTAARSCSTDSWTLWRLSRREAFPAAVDVYNIFPVSIMGNFELLNRLKVSDAGISRRVLDTLVLSEHDMRHPRLWRRYGYCGLAAESGPREVRGDLPRE